MTELMDAEDRLRIALPGTYIEAVEDFGVRDTDDWRLYQPKELLWFTEHPLSETVSTKHEALVLGEAKQGDALLVMLGFEVAGIPTLSDEVYKLDENGVDADPVALDMVHLLEDGRALALGRRETLSETAFEVRATPQKVGEALVEALRGRGFDAPPPTFDPDGEYVEVFIGDSAPTLIVLRSGDMLWLGRRLATLLDTTARACAVTLEDEMVETRNGEWEFPVRTRSVDITKDGQMVDRETAFTGETANYGDPYETIRAVLHEVIERQSLGTGQVVEFYRPAPDEELSERLVTLLGVLAEANDTSLTEIAGQQALRMELADGSVQMSVVTDEELAILRERGMD